MNGLRVLRRAVVGFVCVCAFSLAFTGNVSHDPLLVPIASAASYQVCDCPCAGDPVCDGAINLFDITRLIAVAFIDGTPVFDPDCPRAREDVNCDSLVNIGDIMWVIDSLFRGGLPPACNPCDCIANPDPCRPVSPIFGNALIVESKQVAKGAVGVQVGIYIQNDVALEAVVIPLQIREITPGAYMTGSYTLAKQGRLAASGMGSNAQVRYYTGPPGPCFSNGSTSPGVASAPTDAVFLYAYLTMGSCMSIGSDGAPGSGTPSTLLAFNVTNTDGYFEIDTACIDPANRLVFSECGSTKTYLPHFTKGVITVGTPPQCTQTVTDPYLLACPRGDIFFDVHLRNALNEPLAGYSDVELDFSRCGALEFFPLPGAYPSWPIVDAALSSDSAGLIRFAIAAGGNCPDCSVTVRTGCGYSKTVPVRSVDLDGNAWVLPNDYSDALGMCRDLNADGMVDDADYTRHLAHCCDHKFPGDPCDWLSQRIELVPDGGFAPNDTILIRWRADNNVQGSARHIDSIAFFHSEWTVNPAWQHVGALARNADVPPGGHDIDSLVYVVPNLGKICLRALLYCDCCATPKEEILCADVIRQCPPDAICYEFRTLRLASADETVVRHSLPLALGWSYVITTIGDTTITKICTSDITPVGTEGTLTHYYRAGSVWDHFDYRVIQDYSEGDLCGGPTGLSDCVVDVFDLICLIDFVFSGGPPPVPEENADINCDGVPDIFDVVRHIDFIFGGSDPPPDCGAGPGMTYR